MNDDTKILCWRDLCDQVLKLENKNANQLDIIAGLRKELSGLRAELKAAQDKLAAQAPLFEVGKCYRNRRGDLVRLESLDIQDFPFRSKYVAYDGYGAAHRIDGSARYDKRYDLLPAPVDPPPTWTPWPWLPDGEYLVSFADNKWICRKHIVSWIGMSFRHARKHIVSWIGMSFQHARQLLGYTSDPAPGRWKVKNGTATWMGDA